MRQAPPPRVRVCSVACSPFHASWGCGWPWERPRSHREAPREPCACVHPRVTVVAAELPTGAIPGATPTRPRVSGQRGTGRETGSVNSK